MHLAIGSGYRAVALYHHSGVVIESGGTALKERGDDDHTEFACQLAEILGRRAGDGFGQVEVVYILYLTEVE